MASWILVPCLVSLRDEFNRLAPGRDKSSDGSIGDTSHSASSSDHNPDETGNTPYEDSDNTNEVHAIDVDAGLRKSGWTMTKCVEIIVTRHREGRDNRLQNVIYNRRIWSRSWGWTAREYTGASAHTEHAHFSARYTTAQERDTRAWGLLEADDVTKSEFTAWMTEWARSTAGREALARAVLTYDPGKDANGKTRPGGIVNPGGDAASNPTVGPAWALNRAIVASIVGYQIRDRVDNVQAGVDALLKGSGQAVGRQIDPQSALDSLGAGELTPEETAAALRAALGDDHAATVGRLLAG
ncbi:hypothetical protein Asp14428_65940 [Actinoplanes sp. NBRC 14428]|uniref:Uncharacterized protein n=1 Tax=Pseudosporangium ferrugineum TaxID=439699 RepID=A0A2T0RP24_9ACTN|nr:hypothetical protein [Pseudosporangium ferrugineum]PRY22870.1 hypothetical protein CLV70_116130 [Pseudosporangium ferrugineum]BCJ55119.1 hypothetical protein Asp14428_65940 [Actinoplanes sp. NBRC 14428]